LPRIQKTLQKVCSIATKALYTLHYSSLMLYLDGPVVKGSKMLLTRRHTVGNTQRSMSSSSGRSSLSPPRSDDVTTSQSDLNSDDVFSDDVASDHDSEVFKSKLCLSFIFI